jgi:hypothetical protein
MDTIERLGDYTQAQVKHWNSLTLMRWISCLYQADGMEGSAKHIFQLR